MTEHRVEVYPALKLQYTLAALFLFRSFSGLQKTPERRLKSIFRIGKEHDQKNRAGECSQPRPIIIIIRVIAHLIAPSFVFAKHGYWDRNKFTVIRTAIAVMVVWFATRERVFYGRVSRRRLHPARHYAAVAIRTMPLVGHTGSRARDRFRFSPSEATHPKLPALRLCGSRCLYSHGRDDMKRERSFSGLRAISCKFLVCI